MSFLASAEGSRGPSPSSECPVAPGLHPDSTRTTSSGHASNRVRVTGTTLLGMRSLCNDDMTHGGDVYSWERKGERKRAQLQYILVIKRAAWVPRPRAAAVLSAARLGRA